MKKALVMAFLFLGLASSCLAAAKPEDLPLLRKLNGAYYCLSAQGMKSFQCDVQMSFPYWFRKDLLAKKEVGLYIDAVPKMKIRFKDEGGGHITVDVTPAPSTMNSFWDDKLEKMSERVPRLLKAPMEFWNSVMMGPFNTEKNLAEDDYKINP